MVVKKRGQNEECTQNVGKPISVLDPDRIWILQIFFNQNVTKGKIQNKNSAIGFTLPPCQDPVKNRPDPKHWRCSVG